MFETFELMLRLTESTVKNENETVESGLVNINFVVVEIPGRVSQLCTVVRQMILCPPRGASCPRDVDP